MKRFLFGNFILAGLLLVIAYFAVASVVPMDLLMIPLTGASFGAALLVTLVYAPLFWQSTKKPDGRVAVLAVGIGLLWASFLGTRAISAFLRAIGRPDLLLNHPLIGFMVFLGLLAGVFHVAAPGYPPEGFREKLGGRYRWLIVGFVVGGAALAVLLTVAGVRF